MAKLILSALLSAIKGTYAGSTFQDWKGIQVLRRTPHGSPYISEYRSFVMGIFSTLSGCFYSLSSAQQSAWDDFADISSAVMSGFDAFIKNNTALLATQNPALGLNVTAPELYVKPDTPVYVSARYSRTKDRFIFNWATPAAVTTYVTAFSAVQSGYSNWKSPKWRSGVTLPSSYNRCYFDVSEYPDAQIFRFRGRSIFQNGVFSSYSARVTALKSDVYSYPPWVYVTDESLQRIVKFNTVGLIYTNSAGQYGTDPDDFSDPFGLCCDEDFLYICDSVNDRIVKRYKDDLSVHSVFGSAGSGDDNFQNPRGICCDATYLYICDTDNDRIKLHLKSDLSFVDEFGSSGAGDAQFDTPKDICIYGNFLYITDSVNDRICIWNKSTLAYLEDFGTSGAGDDNFNDPVGIDCDGTYIYIVDKGNHRLKLHLLSDYSYHSFFGSEGTGNTNLKFPEYCAIDSEYIFIADSANQRLMVINITSLTFVNSLAIAGSDPEEDYLPIGVCTMTLYP